MVKIPTPPSFICDASAVVHHRHANPALPGYHHDARALAPSNCFLPRPPLQRWRRYRRLVHTEKKFYARLVMHTDSQPAPLGYR